MKNQILKNSVGSLIDKDLVINHKNGVEYFRLHDVSSIKMQRRRNYTSMIIFFILGLIPIAFLGYVILEASMPAGLEILFLLFMSVIFFTMSSVTFKNGYEIIVSIQGRDSKPLRIMKKDKSHAEELIASVMRVGR